MTLNFSILNGIDEIDRSANVAAAEAKDRANGTTESSNLRSCDPSERGQHILYFISMSCPGVLS